MVVAFPDFEGLNKVDIASPYFQGWKLKNCQSDLVGKLFDPLNHSRKPPLDGFNHVYVLPCLGVPEAYTIVKMGKNIGFIQIQHQFRIPAREGTLDLANDSAACRSNLSAMLVEA